MSRDSASLAVEAADRFFERLNECVTAPPILNALRADLVGNCLLNEVSGLLAGIAEGVIQRGQPRLREAAVDLIRASTQWQLPRGDGLNLETPLDGLYDILFDLLHTCGHLGLAVQDVSFEQRQRLRPPSSATRGE